MMVQLILLGGYVSAIHEQSVLYEAQRYAATRSAINI